MQAKFAIAPDDVITTGFYRSNLPLLVEPVSGQDKRRRLVEWMKARANQPSIVYVTLQKTAEHIDGGQRHRDGAGDLPDHAFGQRGGQHGADDDDRGNGIGDRHQRRMQGRCDGPDHVVTDVDRQHEDDQVDDGVTDFHIVL